MGALPQIMADGKTPAQWVDELAGLGIEVSERTLRARARALGACKMLGSAMILLPGHIDQIFEEPLCRSNRTLEDAPGGLGDALLIATSTSERALERLTKLSRKPPSGNSNGRRGNVVSLAPTRRDRKTN
jgi:hypothetical protein